MRRDNKDVVNISVISKKFVWIARQKFSSSSAMKILA